MECVLALDIGGTKVAAALVDRDGRFIARTATRWQPDQTQAAWQGVVEAVAAVWPQPYPDPNLAMVGIGVGVPAVLDLDSGLVLWAPNIPAWDRFPLAAKLRAEFGRPAWLGFDGHMATLGEYWLGAGRGVQDLAMLAVGTGIGGGIISGGRLLQGVLGLAGAVGWMRVGLPPTMRSAVGPAGPVGQARPTQPYPGWIEKSGQLGFLESLAAGPAILARANHLAQACVHATGDTVGAPEPASEPEPKPLPNPGPEPGPDRVERGRAGRTLYPDTPAVFSACRQGEPPAVQAVEEAAWALGAAAANLVSSVGCRRIILGGGVGEQADLLLPTMRRVMAEYAQPWMVREVQVVRAELGNAAGLAGAARLAWQGVGRTS